MTELIRTPHHDIGQRAMLAGDNLTAQNAYMQVLERNRDDLEAVFHAGLIFLNTGRPDVALSMLRRAVRLKEEFGTLYNLGYAYGTVGFYSECANVLTLATEHINADVPAQLRWAAYHWLGVAHYHLGQWDDAIAAFDVALTYNIGNEETIDKRGLALLGRGDYVQGLIDNKIRWSVLVAHPLMHSSIPQWQGEDLTGKSICVLHEQGFGDTFQFVRFVPRLKAMGAAKTIMSVPGALKSVFEASALADEIVDVQATPACDYIVPMMTVPAHLGLRIETIPFEPYLRAPAREHVLPDNGRPKIGVVWGGKPMYATDKWRSMALLNLLPMLERPEFDFYSLQADERAAELWQTGLCAYMPSLAPKLTDWGRTAAIIDQLDALVSVDTGIAHLAGGMNKPVHLMIANASCWRWHNHDTVSTPWYAGMRLHRQSRQGDWGPVVQSVTDNLLTFYGP